jgi:serine/threonine-protein kinase
VHRDLKPANLFLTAYDDGSPCVKVLDFGVSKLACEANAVTMINSTAIVGTPLYMAPEQFASPRDVDARADVWALGVCLYELLTGEVPFRERNIHRQYALIITRAAPLPRSRRPDIPAALEEVILKCLRRDPEERFQTVAELASALEDAVPAAARHSLTGIARLTNRTRVSRLSTLRPMVAPLSRTPADQSAGRTVIIGRAAAARRASLVAVAGAVMAAAAFFVAQRPRDNGESQPIVVYAPHAAEALAGRATAAAAPDPRAGSGEALSAAAPAAVDSSGDVPAVTPEPIEPVGTSAVDGGAHRGARHVRARAR